MQVQTIRYEMNSKNFDKIPGSPIAYWVSNKIYQAFTSVKGFPGETRKGILTGDNNTYLRLWHEVDIRKIGHSIDSYQGMVHSDYKWFLLTSGGDKRRWYGNIDTVVNLQNDGNDIRKNVKNYRLRESKYYFQEAISWTEVCSGIFSCRYVPTGVLFGNGGPSCFFYNGKLEYVLGLLNTKVVQDMMTYLAPTLNYGPDQISRVPVLFDKEQVIDDLVVCNIGTSKKDWDSFETSWDFKKHPLI